MRVAEVDKSREAVPCIPLTRNRRRVAGSPRWSAAHRTTGGSSGAEGFVICWRDGTRGLVAVAGETATGPASDADGPHATERCRMAGGLVGSYPPQLRWRSRHRSGSSQSATGGSRFLVLPWVRRRAGCWRCWPGGWRPGKPRCSWRRAGLRTGSLGNCLMGPRPATGDPLVADAQRRLVESLWAPAGCPVHVEQMLPQGSHMRTTVLRRASSAAGVSRSVAAGPAWVAVVRSSRT